MGKYVIKVRVSYRDYGSSFKIHYKTFNPYGRLNPIEIMRDVPHIYTFERRSSITNKNKIEISKEEEII